MTKRRNHLAAFFISLRRRSLFFYAVVGFFNTLLYILMFQLLWKILYLNYRFAVTGAYLVSVIFHFSTNRIITFQSGQGKLYHQIPRYIAMIVINYLITIAVVEVTVGVMLRSPNVGMLCAVVITVITGYLLSKHWVFQLGER
jgi:putative flippase GtrA